MHFFYGVWQRSKSRPLFLQRFQYSDTENKWALTALHSVLESLGVQVLQTPSILNNNMVQFYINLLNLSPVQTTGIKEERIEFFIFPTVGLIRFFWSYPKLSPPSYPRSSQWKTGPSSNCLYQLLLSVAYLVIFLCKWVTSPSYNPNLEDQSLSPRQVAFSKLVKPCLPTHNSPSNMRYGCHCSFDDNFSPATPEVSFLLGNTILT